MLGYPADKALICGYDMVCKLVPFFIALKAWLRVPAVNIWSIIYESQNRERTY